jgi:group I intron endonuclease
MKKNNGVYKIECVAPGEAYGRCYIGSGVNLVAHRWSNHEWKMENGEHNKKLQADVDKYGIENFKFDVLKYCHKYELDDLEEDYFNIYKPYYNIDQKPKRRKLNWYQNQKMKEKMSESQRGNNNPRWSGKIKDDMEALKIKVLATYSEMKNKDIAALYNISPGFVSAIKTGKRYKHISIEDLSQIDIDNIFSEFGCASESASFYLGA